MHEETRERLVKLFEWTRRFVHIGFIPLIIYIGYTRSVPKPSLLKMISPLAQ
ncbi:uncharacterized protein BJ171DRAFT_498879 [Polychytrium aggregatum]|uniref:uncharacterized protein n=1 Tax=Polychytrium aggregatum TaxID=110093 RepID=UPI0022FE5E3B|nr:uncharacterized protein BJ171DRAFT_498879 [Polychytrium aggregatum]KAI9206155.1 hypothetical protein BJ171DRAFT_498879 [Polychytrium aggregatum]